MRVHVPTIFLVTVLLVADAALFLPMAEAKTRHAIAAAPSASSHKQAKALATRAPARVSAKASAPGKSKRENARAGLVTRQTPVLKRASAREVRGERTAKGSSRGVMVAERRPTRQAQRVEPARAEVPVVAQPALEPEIHVTHDRKQHHPLPTGDAAGKATAADFLSPQASIARPVKGIAGKSPAQPVPVVSVVRPTELRPQLRPMEEEVLAPIILPALYNKRGRLMVPPPLKGSHEILVRQNEVADREGLDRVRDDEDLRRMREARMLVTVAASGALQWDDRLPADRRYVRPWTAQFLSAMSRAHYQQFHTPLQVNSAVRTVDFQQRLMHVNGNAAPAEGSTASPHLTGQAVDLGKRGLSMREIAWMRAYLLPLVQAGKVDVEEEFQQSCFHISVYTVYLPAMPRTIQTNHRGMALAAAME